MEASRKSATDEKAPVGASVAAEAVAAPADSEAPEPRQSTSAQNTENAPQSGAASATPVAPAPTAPVTAPAAGTAPVVAPVAPVAVTLIALSAPPFGGFDLELEISWEAPDGMFFDIDYDVDEALRFHGFHHHGGVPADRFCPDCGRHL
ncbi:hypothetical protein MKEN_00228300 [Mycena kentingensis (nom. inval.)]|nr:hypothetical protein MKEN_00228300 [Mycena kentingensis (nom. inval.)]